MCPRVHLPIRDNSIWLEVEKMANEENVSMVAAVNVILNAERNKRYAVTLSIFIIYTAIYTVYYCRFAEAIFFCYDY